MDEPKKKKFSLSDINRKLDENDAVANTHDESAVPVSPQPLLQEHESPDRQPERPSSRKTPLPSSARAGGGQALSPSKSDDGEEEQFDILKYVGIILRRKTPIIVVVVLALLYSLFLYMRGEKYYVTNARLLFKPEQQEIIMNNQEVWYMVDRDKMMNTHLELLKSRAVLERVSENTGGKISAASLEADITVKQGESEGQKNDIIELGFRNPDPELARDVVNDLCKSYIEYRREVNSQEYTRFIFKLETQIAKVQADLKEKEDALRVFKENNRMVALTDETNLVVTKLSNIELANQQANLDLLEIRERLISLKAQIGQQDVNVVESMTYDNTYQNRLADLTMQLNTLSAEYSPVHYKVRMVKQEIDKLKAAKSQDIQNQAARSTTYVKNPIRQSLIQELIKLTIENNALETKRTTEKQLLEQLNSELVKLPSLQQNYASLERETESLVQTLAMLKTKFEEAKIKRDSQESDLKILELAQTPTSAFSSVKFNRVLMNLLIGLILGISLAFLLEYLDQTLKSPSEVEKTLEIPLIGIVPLISGEKPLIEHSKNTAKSVLEPFRAVRANLKHIASQNELKTLIICSAVKGEGKTTLAANLAITFALDGKKVILVDCDLRRSQIHKLFNLPKEIGVTEYLLASVEIEQIIKKTSYENLFVVTCGQQPQNSAELVGTPRFKALVQELRNHADLVLFDSPAILPVSDVISMAPHIDGVILVLRTAWTPLKGARQAKNQLQRIGCPIYGGVLNGISHSKSYYPYYYGYYGYYSYKYAYEYEDDQKKKFSWREIGIASESYLKKVLQSIHLYIPHYSAIAGSFFRYCIKRPVFWLLLVLFLALFYAGIFLKSTGASKKTAGIQYLDTLENNEGPGTLRKVQQGPPSGISLDEAGTSVPSRSLDTAAGNSASAASGVPAMDSAAFLHSFEDSINRWGAAFNNHVVPEYIRFYDTVHFTFPGGSFVQWRSEIEKVLLSAAGGKGILMIDSVRVLSSEPRLCKTSTTLTEISKKDTAHIMVTMLWQNSGGLWRIVAEKREKAR